MALVALASFLWWPDPAGTEAFKPYAIVPAALARHLLDAGAGVRVSSVNFLSAGAQIGFFGFVLLLFLALQIVVVRKVRSTVARWLIYGNAPVFLIVLAAFLLAPLAPKGEFNSARVGIVVDHPGAPPAPADGTSRPPVPAYHLQPDALPPLLADEGRYLLAQQAYFEADPRRAAMHLQRMTGAWRPEFAIDRERIGILDQWVAAHGYDAGPVAHQIGDGPYATLRRLAAMLVLLSGGLLIACGVVLDSAGSRRKKRCEILMKRLAAVGEEPVAPLTPAGFGRRNAPVATPG